MQKMIFCWSFYFRIKFAGHIEVNNDPSPLPKTTTYAMLGTLT